MFSQAETELTAKLDLSLDDLKFSGRDLKAFRKKKKLTQQQFADLYGFNFYTVRDWEQSNRYLPYSVSRKIMDSSNDTINFT